MQGKNPSLKIEKNLTYRGANMSYEIMSIVLLIINVLFMLITSAILGYVISKANSIPKERDIVKQIMEAKVPVAFNPNMIPPGMQNPEGPQEPLPPPGKKGNYFG